MLAAGLVLVTDIASMAANLAFCNVKDSFDHSIILLWQCHILSHHINSFSSTCIHLQHMETSSVAPLEWTAVLRTLIGQCSWTERQEYEGCLPHQRSHLVLTCCQAAVALWSMLTLCFLHSYSYVHAWVSHLFLVSGKGVTLHWPLCQQEVKNKCSTCANNKLLLGYK